MSSTSSIQRCPCVPGRIGIWKMLDLVKGGKPENPEKNPRRRDEDAINIYLH